jgi:hypothetical protein
MGYLNRVPLLEMALLHAHHPRQVNDVIVELRFMVGCLSQIVDSCVSARVLNTCAHLRPTQRYVQGIHIHLLNMLLQAHIVSMHLCAAVLRRCAVLVDTCTNSLYSHARCQARVLMPAYDEIALGIRESDDILQFLHPDLKQYYLKTIRPRLVNYMADSDDSSVEDVEHIQLSHSAVKRQRQCENSVTVSLQTLRLRTCLKRTRENNKENIDPNFPPAIKFCSNCKLRPVAAFTYCMSDWCCDCDSSLWSTRPQI